MMKKYSFVKKQSRHPKRLPRFTHMFKRELEEKLTETLHHLRDHAILLDGLQKNIKNNNNEKSLQKSETALYQIELMLMKLESITSKLELTDVVYDTSKHQAD